MQGRSQTFQNEGAARAAQRADWDSKWRLTIDLCTKCNFIGGKKGGRVSARGQLPPAPLWLRHCINGTKCVCCVESTQLSNLSSL